MDIFDILPDEVYGAIDEHAYKFLSEQGYYTEGAITSTKKQKNILKAMRKRKQKLRVRNSIGADKSYILLWFELCDIENNLIARSKKIKFVIGREVNGRENG